MVRLPNEKHDLCRACRAPDYIYKSPTTLYYRGLEVTRVSDDVA
jgi:hypothetical protein